MFWMLFNEIFRESKTWKKWKEKMQENEKLTGKSVYKEYLIIILIHMQIQYLKRF